MSPNVAMNSTMSGWLTSGRSTTRSMQSASTSMTPIASSRASGAGTPRSVRPTRVRAANTTMMPWAKLNTPDAL